ncbi:MAG: YafY family transcriptional regulator [Clostridia bacterium]|nr:YafY family transcriptional regulator [Clostridia bacterium]MDE6355706.1 YafY family transcriptional regulator [Clostridia bacterium]
MKYEIMFRIMMRLLQKRKITAREIAERYEVSVRSVYRYIEELIVCGVPIDVERGRYGGITIADTFRLPVGYFTKEEYAATVNALTAMSSQISDASIISAIEKLQSTQKNERRDLSVCGNIIVDGGAWGDGNKFSDKMFVCEQAVNERKSLLIDYISREGEHSKRVIDPHVLIFKQNVWYVYAFCHTKQEFRTFKIGRIRFATFTGAQFEKREISRDELNFGLSYSDKQMLNVTLEIEKSSLADAEEWLGVDNIEPRGESFVASMQLPDDNVLVNKILSYGGAVKVLDPPLLKERVKAAAKKIAGL